MALVPFTGTVDAATLNANFNDAVAALQSQATTNQRDCPIFLKIKNLTTPSTTVDYIDFTPTDDWGLTALRVYATDATAGQIVTATLTVSNGDTTFLCDQTITKSVTTTAGGVVQATADYRTVTGIRVRLLRGVPYRLKLTTDSGTIDEARAIVLVRAIARKA